MVNALLLLLATILWGFGFVTSRWVLVDYSPLVANSLRYILAALLAFPGLMVFRSYKRGTRYFRLSFIAATILYLSMFLQIEGLKYTTVAKNGFITVLYALFTPLIARLIYRTKQGLHFWPLLMMAILGIFLMCDMSFESVNWGDFLTALCALLFSFHILYLDRIARFVPSALEFNLAQCFWMGGMGLLTLLLSNEVWSFEQFFKPSIMENLTQASSLSGLIFLSFFSSIVAFSIQVHAQKSLSPHIVGLIFLLESPFAAIFGLWFLNEQLTFTNMVGAALVMFAVGLLPYIERRKKIKKAVDA